MASVWESDLVVHTYNPGMWEKHEFESSLISGESFYKAGEEAKDRLEEIVQDWGDRLIGMQN